MLIDSIVNDALLRYAEARMIIKNHLRGCKQKQC